MLPNQCHSLLEARPLGCFQLIAVCEDKPVKSRFHRLPYGICRLFPVVDLEYVSIHLALAHLLWDDDTGNALVMGLLGVEPIGVVIPRPLNEDLILSEAVRPVRTAEPHQHLVIRFLAFRCAANNPLVDVKVLLEAVYMGIHQLLQLRDNVHIRMFLLHRRYSNPTS